MASSVRLTLTVAWVLVAMAGWLAVSGQLFDDERAGFYVDFISERVTLFSFQMLL